VILEIVAYGHPALRAKGRRIEVVDDGVRRLAQDMIDTMRDADGVGLAAQQVGIPVQLCVVDIAAVRDRPSRMRIGGKRVDPKEHMPLILLNPEIELLGPEEEGAEGCLSFPGIQADIVRPGSVRVSAGLLDGGTIEFEASGLLARAVQHEHDHLHGILFIDRMSPEDRSDLAGEIDRIAADSL